MLINLSSTQNLCRGEHPYRDFFIPMCLPLKIDFHEAAAVYHGINKIESGSAETYCASVLPDF